MTFSELCDLYFAEGVANKKPSTLRFDRTRARLHLVPLLGSKRVEVPYARRYRTDAGCGRKRPQHREGKRRRSGVREASRKGGPGAAAQCVIKGFFFFLKKKKKKKKKKGGTRGVDKPKIWAIERFLSTEELGRLADLLP